MFAHVDDHDKPYSEITGIHDDDGYRTVRNMLAEQKNMFNLIPQIEVTNVDVRGDRTLTLRHSIRNETQLQSKSVEDTLYHVQKIWDFDVELQSVNENGDLVDEWKCKRLK